MEYFFFHIILSKRFSSIFFFYIFCFRISNTNNKNMIFKWNPRIINDRGVQSRQQLVRMHSVLAWIIRMYFNKPHKPEKMFQNICFAFTVLSSKSNFIFYQQQNFPNFYKLQKSSKCMFFDKKKFRMKLNKPSPFVFQFEMKGFVFFFLSVIELNTSCVLFSFLFHRLLLRLNIPGHFISLFFQF